MMAHRRTLLRGVLALLAPGALARAAEATLSTHAEGEAIPPPELPDDRPAPVFLLDGMHWRITGGPEPRAHRLTRAEAIGDVPQPEPIGHRCLILSTDTMVGLEWAEDPRPSCTRCLYLCNARPRGDGDGWHCYIGCEGEEGGQHTGAFPGPDDPGYLGQLQWQ